MTAENACFYCLTETDFVSCTTSCLGEAGIVPAFPGTILFGSLLLAFAFFILALHFRKDLKKFVGLKLASIAFASTTIFVTGLVFGGHTILKELPILIPAFGIGSYMLTHFFSFYLVKASYKTIRFGGKEDVLSKLSRAVGVKAPKLYVIFDKVPRAFSIYGFRKAIFISDSLLEKLNSKEIETVLLHELYHIKRKTGLFKNIINTLSNLNFRLIPAPVAELEHYEEKEIDKILLKKHRIDTNLVRRKLWSKH